MMKIKNLLLLSTLMLLTIGSTYGQLEWVKYEGSIPEYAVIGGVETNRSLPICRCYYKGGMHPGKVVEKGCNIGYGGKEKVFKNYEVLVNKGVTELDWVKTEDGSLPDHAIQAGKENGKPMYIGRASHENGTHPGKVFSVGKNNICNIGYAGKEITKNSFEVLVEHKSDPNVARLSHDETRCGYDMDKLTPKKMLKTASKKMTETISRKKEKTKAPSAINAKYIGQMMKERQVNEGESLVSSNMKYQVRVTDDGRLVVEEVIDRALCEDGRILIFKSNEIWSNTNKKGNPDLDYYLKFQDDGNLCIYSEQSGFVWCSMSNGINGHHLTISNVGHIEVVDHHGGEVWPH
ncbi:MAG: DUF3421 domain-containing protein [Saprospiraceae bacterium]|nr:DUF3421 domain-containing protein [Saprospiraceae bacterium]